eukprot:scaffold60928_cov68-Phaeocystis_antarctica.AAC.1
MSAGSVLGFELGRCNHEAVVGPCARPPPPEVTCRGQRPPVSGRRGRLQRAQRCSGGAKRGGEGVQWAEVAEKVRREGAARGCEEYEGGGYTR